MAETKKINPYHDQTIGAIRTLTTIVLIFIKKPFSFYEIWYKLIIWQKRTLLVYKGISVFIVFDTDKVRILSICLVAITDVQNIASNYLFNFYIVDKY